MSRIARRPAWRSRPRPQCHVRSGSHGVGVGTVARDGRQPSKDHVDVVGQRVDADVGGQIAVVVGLLQAFSIASRPSRRSSRSTGSEMTRHPRG